MSEGIREKIAFWVVMLTDFKKFRIFLQEHAGRSTKMKRNIFPYLWFFSELFLVWRMVVALASGDGQFSEVYAMFMTFSAAVVGFWASL